MENINDVLVRWHRRLEQGLYLPVDVFEDQAFDDLVAVLVASAYIESVLWIGIQFVGFDAEGKGKSMPLERVLAVAWKRGLIGKSQLKMLKRFAKIRNGMAHDLDGRLEFSRMRSLYELLPDENREAIERGSSNIYPEVSENMLARLILDQLCGLAHDAMGEAIVRWQKENATATP